MKTFIKTNHIKVVCAFVLLVCLVLPFSSCHRDLDANGKLAYISKKPVAKTVTEYYYPFKLFKPRNFSNWIFIYSFFWPIPILLYRYFGKRRRIQTILWISEPVFVLGALYLLIIETILYTPEIGERLAMGANGGYGLTWLYELARKIIQSVKRRI